MGLASCATPSVERFKKALQSFAPTWVDVSLALVLVLPLIVLLSNLVLRSTHEILLEGDYAIIEIGAVQASQGDRLVGLSSKFLWYHPGPFYFYVLAPFQALLPEGGYALFAGAWFVAVGAFGAILYVLFGIGNRLLFLTLLFAISRYLYECPDKGDAPVAVEI